jgi:hypothetical protein
MRNRFRMYGFHEIRMDTWGAICDRDDEDSLRLGGRRPTTQEITRMVRRNG